MLGAISGFASAIAAVRSQGIGSAKKNRPRKAAGFGYGRMQRRDQWPFIASLALLAAVFIESAAWPALWAASFMASIALAWVEAGAGAVLAGIAAVEAGAACIAFEAALAAEDAAPAASEAAPAACEAALAAEEVALAAFCAACCA